MNNQHPHMQGGKIVNGRGETVHLRGFCLGGWMNMESFIRQPAVVEGTD